MNLFQRLHSVIHQVIKRTLIIFPQKKHFEVKYRKKAINQWFLKINEEGKLNYFLDEVTMEKAEENPKDLAKQVKYLKQKLAYYEALAEECGIKVDKVSKKNGAGQSSGQPKKQEGN